MKAFSNWYVESTLWHYHPLNDTKHWKPIYCRTWTEHMYSWHHHQHSWLWTMETCIYFCNIYEEEKLCLHIRSFTDKPNSKLHMSIEDQHICESHNLCSKLPNIYCLSLSFIFFLQWNWSWYHFGCIAGTQLTFTFSTVNAFTVISNLFLVSNQFVCVKHWEISINSLHQTLHNSSTSLNIIKQKLDLAKMF